MRVLLGVHQFFPDRYTGTEGYTLDLARELRRRGHAVAVVTYARPSPATDRDDLLRYDYNGLPVFAVRAFPAPWEGDIAFAYESAVAARQFDDAVAAFAPDIVHFTHLMRLGRGSLVALRRRRIPFVVTLTDFFTLCPRIILMDRDGNHCEGPCFNDCVWCMTGTRTPVSHRVALPEEAFADYDATLATDGFAEADAQRAVGQRYLRMRHDLLEAATLLAPTRFLRDVYIRNGYPPERVSYRPFGLDQGWLAGYAHRPATTDTLRVGFLGSVVGHKGPDVLVEAFRHLPHANVQLDIHGECPIPAFAAELRSRIGGDPRIIVHGAFDREEQPHLLAGLDVLVVPSRWYENTPLVLCAAVLAGVPVVGSDMGGITELVRHEENGLVFGAGDADALSIALRRLVEDRGLVRRLSGQPVVLPTVQQEGEWLEARYVQYVQTAGQGA